MTVNDSDFMDRMKTKRRIKTSVEQKFYREQADTDEVLSFIRNDRSVYDAVVGKDNSMDIKIEYRGNLYSLELE